MSPRSSPLRATCFPSPRRSLLIHGLPGSGRRPTEALAEPGSLGSAFFLLTPFVAARAKWKKPGLWLIGRKGTPRPTIAIWPEVGSGPSAGPALLGVRSTGSPALKLVDLKKAEDWRHAPVVADIASTPTAANEFDKELCTPEGMTAQIVIIRSCKRPKSALSCDLPYEKTPSQPSGNVQENGQHPLSEVSFPKLPRLL